MDFKRTFDVVASAAGLIVLSPVMAAVALLVYRNLGSPVLFRQTRPGRGARPFEILKFRTMRDGWNSSGKPLPDGERLTRFGQFLRSTSLDELPGLWNVLKGDMSLVGPRPLLMEYLPYYTANERRRHDVRPGVTGWSQVNGRNTASWSERMERDIWYVDNISLRLDLKILLMTLAKMMHREGVVIDPRSAMSDFNVARRASVELRPLGPEDAAAAARILQEAYDPEQFAHTIMVSPKLDLFFRDVLFGRDRFIGAFRNGELRGVLQIREFPDRFHLNNVAVTEAERGWGLADLLMQELWRVAQGRPTDLYVDSRNAAALRFYRRHGYKEAGRTPFVTLNLPLAIGLPSARRAAVLDPVPLEKYGFGYLTVEGVGGQIGFVTPGQLFVQEGSEAALLEAAVTYPAARSVTFPKTLEIHLPKRLSGRYWDRIRMMRE